MHKQIPLAISSDAALTFDNFYQTENAKLVVSELKNITQVGGAYVEPFIYVWGEYESGITHLLNATQNYNTALSMQYLPLNELIDYPADAILDGVETLDLICIDDIELLEGHKHWQEKLFYLFNRLRDAGKKLLVGGHLPPTQLSLEIPDLKSRLQWGVTLQLPSLTDEDKQKAIQYYARQVGMQLGDEVANYLLRRTDRSPRALFALMKQLDHASLAEQRKLTIPFIRTIIS